MRKKYTMKYIYLSLRKWIENHKKKNIFEPVFSPDSFLLPQFFLVFVFSLFLFLYIIFRGLIISFLSSPTSFPFSYFSLRFFHQQFSIFFSSHFFSFSFVILNHIFLNPILLAPRELFSIIVYLSEFIKKFLERDHSRLAPQTKQIFPKVTWNNRRNRNLEREKVNEPRNDNFWATCTSQFT
jgi:hypothetical protein